MDLRIHRPCSAADDRLQLIQRVILQLRDDAEAVSERRAEIARARGGAHQREGRQIQTDAAHRRAVLADHDIDAVILHRRIQHLLHLTGEPVDLVDEQHIPCFQRRQHSGQIAAFFDGWAARRLELAAHLIGQDIGKRRLSQPRRAIKQHMVERLVARPRRVDEDAQVFLELLLPDVFAQRRGTKRDLTFIHRFFFR